jgi:hypothetical protein
MSQNQNRSDDLARLERAVERLHSNLHQLFELVRSNTPGLSERRGETDALRVWEERFQRAAEEGRILGTVSEAEYLRLREFVRSTSSLWARVGRGFHVDHCFFLPIPKDPGPLWGVATVFYKDWGTGVEEVWGMSLDVANSVYSFFEARDWRPLPNGSRAYVSVARGADGRRNLRVELITPFSEEVARNTEGNVPF